METRNICLTRHANSARHSEPDKPLSQDYLSLTERGVKQAEATAQEQLLSVITQSQPRTVYFILACSDQERTRDTARVYGAQLKKLAAARDDLVVATEEDIRRIHAEQGTVTATLQKIGTLAQDPQKLVISFPLQVKELSYAYKDRWTKNGKKTDYFETLVGLFDGSHARAVHHWIANQGTLTAEGRLLAGPKPKDVAQQYLDGMTKVHDFAQKIFQDKNVIVHGVGHQWDLDAVVASFVDPEVTYGAFKHATGGNVIGESEFMKIALGKENTVQYRGKMFTRQYKCH